jgi:hypothetical protein
MKSFLINTLLLLNQDLLQICTSKSEFNTIDI